MKFAVGFAAIFCTTAAFAQPPTQTAKPAAKAARADAFGSDYFEVPFHSKYDWIILDIKIGKDAESAAKAQVLHFLLDTGATSSVLAEEALDAKKLDLAPKKKEDQGILVVGVGDSNGVSTSGSITGIILVGGLQINATMSVLPMGPDVHNEGIDGFIGDDVFQQLVILIDYEKHIVRFYNPSTFKPPVPADNFSILALTFDSFSMPLVSAVATPYGFNATEIRMTLDTGSADAVTFFSSSVERNKWKSVLGHSVTTGTTGLGGQSRSSNDIDSRQGVSSRFGRSTER